MPPRAPRKPFKPSEQHAVLVLGMHRSGTSVLARLCNLLGAEIGTALLPARKDNEKGFWEHAEIVDLHEHVLPTLTTAWDDPRELPADWWQDSRLVPYKKKLKQLLKQEFADAPLWIVKDPRLSILMPMWQDILQELQVTPHVLIMLRSPAAVAKSLMKRDAFTAEKALMLWCRYMLDAERATRHMPRSFVAFDALLNDWEQTMQTVAIQTGVQWPKRPSSVAKKVTDFIEPALVHASQNAVLPAIKDATLAIWVQRIDAALNTDGTTDTQTLDQVYAEIQQMYKRDLACYGSWLDEAIVRRYQEIYAQNEIANTRQALKEARRDASQAHTLLKRSESERLVLTHELDTRNQEYSILNAEADQYQQRLARIEASVPWRVWRVLRAMGRRLARLKLFCYPIVYLRILDVLRQEGIGGVLARTKRLLLGSEVQALADYPSWIAQYDTLSDGARDYMMHAIKAMQNPPLISVVMPVYNVEEKWLREAIDSVLAQCYPHWELCIADDCSSKPHIRTILEEYVAKDDRVKVIFRETNGHISESSNSALTLATGSYVALMDHDDLLPEHALFMVAQALAEYPETDMLYTDEDKVDDKGHRYGAYFKSEWNPDLFLGQNMFSHLGVYRRSLLNKIGGFRKGVEGSQDYDLALRCLPYTKPERIRHLPHILYHWRAIPGSTALENMEKDYAQPSSERALSDYFAKQKLQATILPGKDRLVRHIKWALPKISPKVSLFLRTDAPARALETYLTSLLTHTAYTNMEFHVLYTGDANDAQKKELTSAIAVPVVWEPWSENETYAEIVNNAVAKAKGKLCVLLHDILKPLHPEWLEELVSQALRDEVGAVGGTVYDSEEHITAGAYLLGAGRATIPVAACMHAGKHRQDVGYFGRAALVQDVSAVSGQCMAFRKEVWKKVSGFDAEHLQDPFTDIDFCLRLREQGYRILWTPFAEMQCPDTEEEVQEIPRTAVGYMHLRWGNILKTDPFYNPNLNLYHGDFSYAHPPRVGYPWQD